ncbi:EpsG family protein [Vibrio vulnificus]|uniref:EpsG family protein n=1 Tax=Vibrio vulnificus TaxID=672 RepID=UPI0037C254C7
MITYHVILSLLILFSILERFNLLLSRYVPIFFSFIFVLLFTSLRGDVGQDTSNYLEIYNNLESNKQHLESGFYYLSNTLKYFNFSFNGFLFFIGVVSLVFYFVSIYKFVGFGLIVFSFMIIFCDIYIYFNMSGLRQGIALSISLLSGYYAYKGHLFKFLICFIISILFHSSAVVTLLFFPLFKFNIKYNIKFIFYCFIFVLTWVFVLQYLISNVALASGIKGSSMYLSNSYNEFSMSAYAVGIIRRIYPIFIVLLFYSSLSDDKLTMRIFNVYLFGFCVYLVNYPMLQDVTVRISSYFIMFEAVLISCVISRLKSRFNIVSIVIFVLILIYFKVFSYANLESFQYRFMDGIFY